MHPFCRSPNAHMLPRMVRPTKGSAHRTLCAHMRTRASHTLPCLRRASHSASGSVGAGLSRSPNLAVVIASTRDSANAVVTVNSAFSASDPASTSAPASGSRRTLASRRPPATCTSWRAGAKRTDEASRAAVKSAGEVCRAQEWGGGGGERAVLPCMCF